MSRHLDANQFDPVFSRQRLLYLLGDTLNDHRSLLYVGAKPKSIELIDLFNQYDTIIVEAYEKHVEKMEAMMRGDLPMSPAVKQCLKTVFNIQIVHGDVLDLRLNRMFDVSVWWHGPEHVEIDQVEPAIENLVRHTTHLIILACPWGQHIRTDNKNPYGSHKSYIQPDLFEELGFDVETHGKEGPGSTILAIKRL